MLELCGITKKFPAQSRPAVSNLCFSVRPGEIAAILGENGAGKTTALRIISTILRPDSGTCRVMGFDAVKEPGKARRETGILLGGDTGLYDRLTARENISYFADLHGIPRDMQKRKINKIAQLLGMQDYIDRRCAAFSKGMKQKTAFARALIHDPSVILLDEPATGLDVSSSLIVRDFIMHCRKEGKAILFSSHNIDEVKKLADRIIIIHNGRQEENTSQNQLYVKYAKYAKQENDLESVFLAITGQEKS